MRRITGAMDWADLEQLAEDIGAHLVYRRARCQHGYTIDETCRDCEGGYGTDSATYANVGVVAHYGRSTSDPACIAVSDDLADVAYIPAREQSKIPREPIFMLREYAKGKPLSRHAHGLDNLIRRILGRAYDYTRREILEAAETIPVAVGSVDSAAWEDVRLCAANCRQGVRFMGDGSAVTTHFRPDGTPMYRRFVRA